MCRGLHSSQLYAIADNAAHTPQKCASGVQILYVITWGKENGIVHVVFVNEIRKSRSIVGVGGSKNCTFLVNPSGVIVIIAERVDTLSALVPFSPLVNRSERI